jgi:hypothetical protein
MWVWGKRVGGGGSLMPKQEIVVKYVCSTIYKDTTGYRETEKSIFDLSGQIQQD